MKTTIIPLITTLLLLPLLAHAATTPTFSMTLTVMNGSNVQVSMTSQDALDAEFMAAMTSPEVKDIYLEKMTDLFGSADNLSIQTSQGFNLTFTSDLIVPNGTTYKIPSRNFSGILLEMETLRVEMREGYIFVSANPDPKRIEGNILTWEDMEVIPEVVFEKEDGMLERNSFLVILVSLVLILGLIIVFKKRIEN